MKSTAYSPKTQDPSSGPPGGQEGIRIAYVPTPPLPGNPAGRQAKQSSGNTYQTEGNASALLLPAPAPGESDPFQPSPDAAYFPSILADVAEPSLAWEGRAGRAALADASLSWILNWLDPISMVTLTFRECVMPDRARAELAILIRVLNRELFGRKYMGRVGRSYFGFICGLEHTTLDVPHFHMVADRPLHFALIHSHWGERNGFAWCEPVKTPAQAVAYTCKYVVKGGFDNLDFCRGRERLPDPLPSWWPAPRLI